MQKIINVLAVTSFVVSGAVVAAGVTVYVNRDSIKENIKSQIVEAATSGVGEALGGGLTGGLLGGGDKDTPAGSVGESSGGLPVPIPVVPF